MLGHGNRLIKDSAAGTDLELVNSREAGPRDDPGGSRPRGASHLAGPIYGHSAQVTWSIAKAVAALPYLRSVLALLRTQAVELDACQGSGRMSRAPGLRDRVGRAGCSSSLPCRPSPRSTSRRSASPTSTSRRSTRFVFLAPATQRCSALSHGALSFPVSPGPPWPACRAVADPLPRPAGTARPGPGGARPGPGIAVHSAPVREVRSPQASPLSAIPFLAANEFGSIDDTLFR